jgi:hypothetical protein
MATKPKPIDLREERRKAFNAGVKAAMNRLHREASHYALAVWRDACDEEWRKNLDGKSSTLFDARRSVAELLKKPRRKS